MKEKTQTLKIQGFVKTWSDPKRGGEKQDSQLFWMSLLTEVFDIENPAQFIRFEEKVKLDNASFIDGHIPSTKVLIEQKSRGKDLRKAIRQSDGTLLTPYQQAKRYSSELPLSEHPKWIVLSNFDEFHIYDMEKPQGDPEIIYLKDLVKDYYRLNFLVDNFQDKILQREMEISIQAGEIVGKLYSALLKEYRNPKDPETLKSLNELIVRLVFCFYAEDSGIFTNHTQFHDYMKDRRNPRTALIELFDVLDTPEDERDPYLDEDLLEFPYVNGGLFANHGTEIPRLNNQIMEIILHEASEDFDWSEISPTIFGAVFESTLNPETRRSGGMHYTSLENIHKVIDPLFLSDLYSEFDEIKEIQNKSSRTKRLKNFQKKIANLKFLDPACGSGNFLTETYLSLRKLENEALKLILGDQVMFGLGEEFDPIMVSLSQFYGIEINDFAVSVARTALWIAEHQMMKKTEEILHSDLDFLPLKTYTNIHEGNALRMDWENVVSSSELNYIMGNPPFVGSNQQSPQQRAELQLVFEGNKKVVDYVAGWFYKAAQIASNHINLKIAFVATNSIVQGEQISNVWKKILEECKTKIDFAYKPFVWDSEALSKAHVHCVIVGFSSKNNPSLRKLYFSNGQSKQCKNINPYLLDAPDVFVSRRTKPLSAEYKMEKGNQPTDGGNLIIEAKDYEEFIKREPKAKKYIKNLVGAEEFINGKKRYCLWLVGVSPKEIKSMPLVYKRVESCRKDRLNGGSDKKKLADRPTEFRETKNPSQYLLIPATSSENRRYIPIGFMDGDTVSTNLNLIIPGAGLYEFGILVSNVHMAWMRRVAGRLEMRYRYSKDIVYNNFPWPSPDSAQKSKIEKTAQAILDARALYPDSSLAILYDDLTMPKELRRAHQMNDRAVMDAYGFSYRGDNKMTEVDCVGALMKMYQELIEQEKKK